jgi:enoyl-CoA hydratase
MSNYKNLLEDLTDGILTIVINRPEKLNALNVLTLTEIKSAIEKAYDDHDVKGIIIVGAGKKAFVSGADIGEFKELNDLNGRKFAERGQEVFSLLENCHKPTIAVINGYALGGGCELALACHLRIGTENAFLGQPEVSLGVIPAYGGTQRLTQTIGKGTALEMMMTGEMIGSEEARSLGLLNHLVATKEDGIVKAKEILNMIFENAPLAVGMVINCVNSVFRYDEDGFQTEANSFASCCKSQDFTEGTNAFLEKRKPEFRGE